MAAQVVWVDLPQLAIDPELDRGFHPRIVVFERHFWRIYRPHRFKSCLVQGKDFVQRTVDGARACVDCGRSLLNDVVFVTDLRARES